MTLNTDVYVLDRINPDEVFSQCLHILAKYDSEGRSPSEMATEREQDSTWRDGAHTVDPENPWTLETTCGQGLPAWTRLHYRPGVALRTAEESAAHDEDCTLPGRAWWTEGESEACDGKWHKPASWLSVDFDTAYSYRDHGLSCGDLHALIVAELGEWLDARGVRWLWQNEYTGEVHDSAEKLIELTTGAIESSAWFYTAVLPAILRGIES